MLKHYIPWVVEPVVGDWFYNAKLRDICYEAVVKVLKRSKRHGDNLRERGFDNDAIKEMGIKSLYSDPRKFEDIAFDITSEVDYRVQVEPGYEDLTDDDRAELIATVPGFSQSHGEISFDMPRDKAMVIPMRDRFGLITRLRLRLDEPGDKGKYRYLGSDDSGHKASLIHVPIPTRNLLQDANRNQQPPRPLVVAEGEFKAEFATRYMNLPAVSMPGASQYRAAIELARKTAVSGIDWAYDSDHRTNKHVAKALIGAISECRQRDMPCRLMLWDPKYKGIDDIPDGDAQYIRYLDGEALDTYLETLAKEHELDRPDFRPRILIGPDFMGEAAERILDLLAQNGFFRDQRGKICRFDPTTETLLDLSSQALPAQIDRFCLFESADRNGNMVPKSCPADLAKNTYHRTDYEGIPRIKSVLPGPGVLSDGRVVVKAGYDSATETFVLRVPSGWDPSNYVLDRPTRQQAKQCFEQLTALFHDFDFSDEEGPTGAVSALITCVGRSAIDGCVPFFAVTADHPSAGKSLIVESILQIASPSHMGALGYDRKDDEMRKVITAELKNYRSILWFDNVPRGTAIASASLAKLGTSRVWSDRVLGSSESVSRRNEATVFFTGNDISYTDEIARRVITLNIRCQDKAAFVLGELSEYVADHRNDLLGHALTVWCWLWNHDSPNDDKRPIKSFPEWSTWVVDGIEELSGHDLRELVKTNDRAYDADAEQASEFIEAIAQLRPCSQVPTPGYDWWTAKDLAAEMVKFSESPSLHDRVAALTIQDAFSGAMPSPRRLGKRLSAMAFRSSDRYTLVANKPRNTNQYQLLPNESKQDIDRLTSEFRRQHNSK
ncbi:toprim domain-containing protein [Novipirellula artificiosorum]|nr:hypothetical protein [Novipirellula artificiosorum]